MEGNCNREEITQREKREGVMGTRDGEGCKRWGITIHVLHERECTVKVAESGEGMIEMRSH